MKKEVKRLNQAIRIFTDGAGSRSDGTGSGFGWLREDNGERKIIREDRLTNNQAEYKAILSAVESLPTHAKAEILTDSENTCFQLRGERRVRDPHLAELHGRIRALIEQKDLEVIFSWIPRGQNQAGKLL